MKKQKFNNTLYLAGLITEEGMPTPAGGPPGGDLGGGGDAGGGEEGGDDAGPPGPDELAEIADQLRQIADRLSGGGAGGDKQPAPPLGGDMGGAAGPGGPPGM